MVSIFLRMLEYYEGILFLTTNRINNIDDAFHSRIHVSMEYPDLNASSRRHIWANFLKSSTMKNEVSNEDMDKLADILLNGRQIKNVLKKAGMLAAHKEMPLRFEHINTVLAIEQRKHA
jgi:ATP-dependent 26S proteasome regulatory subunit